MKLYLTGGAVRDWLLGLGPSKDIDFAVEAESYEQMVYDLCMTYGVKVWQERPEFVTLRGRLDLSNISNSEFPFGGLLPFDGVVDADFTLCRKETQYSDLRHPDTVTPASIRVDLSRRDFTVNAIAVSEKGEWLDPYNGRQDIRDRILHTVGAPRARFEEDPLRMLRAVRFGVTRHLNFARSLSETLLNYDTCRLASTLPTERVMEEVNKACRVNWRRTMQLLFIEYPALGEIIWKHHNLWMKATMEER